MNWISLLHSVGLILLVILIFNLMIVVHELGHFWAARWRGLVVDRFQIWFGKPLWKKKIHGVEWGLGSVPFGGFVQIPQLSPMEAIEGKTAPEFEGRVLPKAKPLDKIIVALAGPVFSFLLAVAFALLVSCIGHTPQVAGDNRVGWVAADSPAQRAGILPGDRIVAIEGHPVEFFFGAVRSVQERVMLSATERLPVTVERDGKKLELTVVLETKRKRWWQRSEPRTMGVEPFTEPRVKAVMENSPAALAGVKPGDLITAVNGQGIVSTQGLGTALKGGKSAQVELRGADGALREATLAARKPDLPANFPLELVGVSWAAAPEPELVRPRVGEQLWAAATQIGRTLRALTSKNSGVGINDLAGPVGIGEVYYRLLQYDWRLLLAFSVMLNVNLAMLNLLPLPVLDGGHILFALVEWIRRRPVSARLMEPLYTGCALLLFGFMGYKLLQEGWLLGTGKSQPKAEAITEMPRFLPPGQGGATATVAFPATEAAAPVEGERGAGN